MTNAALPGSVDALLATPLFADVGKKLLEGVRKEAALTDGTYEWAPGVARRDGFVHFRSLSADEVIVGQGDLTTELCVVLSGRVEAVQARGGRDVHRHHVYSAGEWFGEVSAHSHHPALASYRATEPTVIATLEARLFKTLYDEDEEFKGRIDESYRQNLGLHLRATSLCKNLDEAALATLQAEAQLATVEAGDGIAKAGEPADTVFLVRAGAIACTATGKQQKRVLAYYKGNATFGEHAVATGDRRWPADYTALMRTSLVKLPLRAFQSLAPAMQANLTRAANRLVDAAEVDAAAGSGVAGRLLDELHVMVERQSVKGGRALVIDRSKCVRCNMCVESCVAVHDDHIPRLSKMGTTVATDEVLVTACYHCEMPECMMSCNYAAIRRDPQGRVRFEYDNCVGCASCIEGCPYGVIRLVEPAPAPAPEPTFFQSLPLIGRWFGTPPEAPPTPPTVAADGKPVKQRSAGVGGKLTEVAGKTIKCDLCAGLPFEACVYNCPTTAILRREPQSLFEGRRGL